MSAVDTVAGESTLLFVGGVKWRQVKHFPFCLRCFFWCLHPIPRSWSQGTGTFISDIWKYPTLRKEVKLLGK